jgi:hypothetical protein
MFAMTAEDFEGHTVSFSAPVAFVAPSVGDLTPAAVEAYDAACKGELRTAGGQLALAPGAGAGVSVVEVTALCVGAANPAADTAADAGELAAFPCLASVHARIPALEAFAPGPGGPRSAANGSPVHRARAGPVALVLDAAYVESGLLPGPGLFARLMDPVNFVPPVTHGGGLAAVSFALSGLSRESGLVGGDPDAFQTGFDPEQFFTTGEGLPLPKLLGFLDLRDLVNGHAAGGTAPKTAVDYTFPNDDPRRPPTAVLATLEWAPSVKPGAHGESGLRLQTTSETALLVESTTRTSLVGGTPPSSEVSGELRSFALTAQEVLTVHFDRLAFRAQSGAQPSLDPRINRVEFAGPLHVLNSLANLLPSPQNGPRVTVTPAAIEVGHTVAVPSVGMGVFLLQNLAVSAGVSLPLDGAPVRARFAVSSRDDPFLVTVSLFGGGGFVAVTTDGDDVHVEAQIEFGAAASLDFVIASASVAVTAGVYLRSDQAGVALSGFFRAVGELDVLGIVNVSVEIYLQLSWTKGTKEIVGAARITVRVRVAFFSESVEIGVERSFSAGSDPTFDKAFSPEAWTERCAAFAPMVDA